MRRRLSRNLFRSLRSSVADYQERPSACRYVFKYYSEYMPYIPLPLILSQRSIMPVVLYNRYRGYGSGSSDYKSMIGKTFNLNRNYLLERHTRGNTYFAIGPGAIYYMPNRNSSTLIPLYVMALAGSKYTKQSKDELLSTQKRYLEVFFHNDLRSVNSTLWGYIRNDYIPLLQLEGIRFQFKDPNEIMDLTTTTYSKPNFSSLGEMQEYREKIDQMSSLQTVFDETAILED